jgi:hypothetical protein
MQPIQLSLIPDPIRGLNSIDPIPMPLLWPVIDQLPEEALAAAIMLLAGVIAKAAAANPMGVAGDE